MSQLRLDPLTGRWVVVSTVRSGRRHGFRPAAGPEREPAGPCPFCPGHEDETPPPLVTYGPTGSWLVRVVPNKYPAFEHPAPMAVTNLGPVFTQAPASGLHEVLVLSPGHAGSWADLDDAQVALVMAAIRDRTREHADRRGLRYSQVIVNSGREAGASIEHPHAQLLGLPFVPPELADELAGFARFEGTCLLCTTVASETIHDYRVVSVDDEVFVGCPFWSASPYEMLVVPRHHAPRLHRAPDADLAAVGRALRDALVLLRARVGPVSYNLIFHSAPYRAPGIFHWHVHVVPKLTTPAGFEFGTGVMINVVAPEAAAEDLRDAGRPEAVGAGE